MSLPNVRDIFRVPGSLCADPTDLTLAFPHGGTALGLVKETNFEFGLEVGIVVAEEFGGQSIETIVPGEAFKLGCILRTYDNDMISRVFLNTLVGSSSGKRIIRYPGTTDGKRPGSKGTDRAFLLCFSPEDIDRHLMLLIFKAIPMVNDSARLTLSLDSEIETGLVFMGVPDSANANESYDIGLREDLSV